MVWLICSSTPFFPANTGCFSTDRHFDIRFVHQDSIQQCIQRNYTGLWIAVVREHVRLAMTINELKIKIFNAFNCFANSNLASNNFSGNLPEIDILFPELLLVCASCLIFQSLMLTNPRFYRGSMNKISNFSNNQLVGSIPFAMSALRFITDLYETALRASNDDEPSLTRNAFFRTF